jgi:hypothetical protein
MLVMVQLFFACRAQDEIYREYVTEGGVVYPGKPDAVAKARIGAVELVWPNNAVTVTEARIWWNNYADSVVVPVTAEMDTVRKRIEMPVEGVYSFFIRTYDRYGNVSVAVEVIGRSIGEKYMNNNFFNRMTTGYKTTGGNNLKIAWEEAETEAGALYCNLFYTAVNGTEKTVRVPAADTLTVLNDWKAGTSLKYNTVYKPDPEDPTLVTTSFREQNGVYVLLDNKSPARVVAYSSQQAAGVAGNAYNGVIDRNRWLSAAGGYPHHIVIDLGEIFNIARFDIWPSNYSGYLDNRMPSLLRWEVSESSATGPWTSLGDYDYDYTMYPYRYDNIPQTAGRFFQLTGLDDPTGLKIMCLAEIDVYIKLGD